MEKFESYETAKAIVESERLPVGGYVLKILKAEEITFDNGGRALKISFDIAEGEFKGFFENNYKSQKDEDKKWKGTFMAFVPKGDKSEKDGWTANAFKTTTEAIEDSNTGYHWDWEEKKLKGKIVGAVFGNKQYEINGRQGMCTDCRHFTSAENIRKNKFKAVKDKLLSGNKVVTGGISAADFEEIDADDSDLPF